MFEEIAAARAARLDYLNEVPADTPNVQLPQPLTREHPHALEATRDLDLFIGRAMWTVHAGNLYDDLDPLIAEARKVGGRNLFRKPPKEA